MKNFLFLIALFISNLSIASDNDNFEFINKEYSPDISTVTLELNGLPSAFPVIRLGSADHLVLKFDDLSNQEKYLYYRIIHCNRDWTPSDMRELDYLNGFNDERLRNYDYSSNTRIQYLHYWQNFPNKDTKLKISGNYLLVIYEDDIQNPVLTRRFIVNEDIVKVEVNDIYPSDVANIRYKQEISVSVFTDNLRINNPLQDVTVVALQNENWGSEKMSKPNIFGNNVLKFNKLGSFEWWGNAEYREFDIRSFFRVGRGVKFIDRKKDGTDIILETTYPRTTKNHIAIFDFNGRFFIENWEQVGGSSILGLGNSISTPEIESILNELNGTLSASTLRSISSNRPEDRNIYSDYAYVTVYLDYGFDLKPNQNIYILGAFNNWTPSDQYMMKFDNGRDMFVSNLFLKQGYYNYYYAIVDDNGNIDIPSMEGSWNETENDYYVFIYIKSLGDLYDRVIGYYPYNTNYKNLY